MAVVFHQGLILTLIGASVGVGAALPAARALTQLLFGISPLDATSFCSSVVLLGLMSVAACVIPALRSAHLDPVRAEERMRQPVLLFILKGEMDCTETADRRLGNSVQLTLTGQCAHPERPGSWLSGRQVD
jgi:hypothetical protein